MLDFVLEGWPDVERAGHAFDRHLRRGMSGAVQKTCDTMVETAKSLVPVSEKSEGTHLRDEIRGGVFSESATSGGGATIEGEVEAAKSYGHFVENGTAPHVIEGRNGGALSFDWNGVPTVLRRVHHPGTKPHPFMGPAYHRGEQALTANSERAVEDACDAFNGSGI